MMTKSRGIVLALALSAICPAAATAGDFWHSVKIGFHRNVCWPLPFVYPDRSDVAAPFAVMANNGWRRNNLLGAHHFSADGQQLSTAGQLKVRWILTQAPVQRRSVFVERSYKTDITGHRIEAVQNFAQKLALNEDSIDVQETHIVTEGRSAIDVDSVNTRFRESSPAPILPAASGSLSLGE